MTYKASSPIPAIFRAHNQAEQNSVGAGVEFLVSELYNCSPHPSGGVKTSKAYVYGDLRTSGISTGSRQVLNVAFKDSIKMPSEGWQTANNTRGVVGADDGVFGVVDGRASLYVTAVETNDADSDAEETRIFGLRLVP
jgi:hypothetical protein